MTERWYQEKKREGFYRRAKREGYRARSAYKLLQIQEKFNLIRAGDVVVDLGASPGSWSQVAVELVGKQGRVFGIDLAPVRPVEGATFLRGDLTDEATAERLRAEMTRADGRPLANAVLSDMSPNLSGNYGMDQAESIFLSTAALRFAEKVLETGGNFLVKVFEGADYKEFFEGVKARFEMLKPYRPEATRRQSSEVYLVAKGYRGAPR